MLAGTYSRCLMMGGAGGDGLCSTVWIINKQYFVESQRNCSNIQPTRHSQFICTHFFCEILVLIMSIHNLRLGDIFHFLNGQKATSLKNNAMK